MKERVQMRRTTWAWKKGDVLVAKSMEMEGMDMAWLELPEGDYPHEVHDGGIWAACNEYEVIGLVDAEMTDVEILMERLSILLAPRNNQAQEWPEDEAEAYRKYGWSEGIAEVQRLRYRKAAEALLAEYQPKVDRSI